MIPSRRILSVACPLLLAAAAFGQDPAGSKPAPPADKAASYYNYSLGHLYAELAGASGNRELFTKAVDSYRAAMKADPGATFIAEELSDLYIQSGRLREAVTEAEDSLKQNPDDLNSRRLLARIYTRLIGDSQANRIDENMVKKAIEQYQKITAGDPKDVESWIMLGRLDKVSQNSTEALTAYKKALELDPENEDAMTGMAQVYTDLGDSKAAADLLRKVADKNPNPRSLMSLANVYEQMKDYSLAAEMLRRALQQQPGQLRSEARAGAGPALFRSSGRRLESLPGFGGRGSERRAGAASNLEDLSAKERFRQGPRGRRQGQGTGSEQSRNPIQRSDPVGG